MQTVTWKEFTEMDPFEILEGPCFQVVDQVRGLIVSVIVRPEGLMNNRVQAISSQIDGSRGRLNMPVKLRDPVEAVEA